MKIALVGLARTSRHLVPWDDPDWEIWSLNESYYIRPELGEEPWLHRWDRWFQMHPCFDYMRAMNNNDPEHPQWLKNEGGDRRRTDFPIYQLEYDERIPGSTVYPFWQILQKYGRNAESLRLYRSTFDYMLALAIDMDPEEIMVRGFEMNPWGHWAFQRESAHLWMGVAMGRGIYVDIPDGSTMITKAPLYGYDQLPGYNPVHAKMAFDSLRNDVNRLQLEHSSVVLERDNLYKKLASANGNDLETKRLEVEMGDLILRERDIDGQLNAASGAMAFAERVMQELQGMPVEDVFRMGYSVINQPPQMMEVPNPTRISTGERVLDDSSKE